MNEVIDGSMTVLTTFTSTAAQTMGAKVINFLSTELTSVGCAKRGAQPQTNCYAKGVIIQAQAQI